jgi:hypothetical protein
VTKKQEGRIMSVARRNADGTFFYASGRQSVLEWLRPAPSSGGVETTTDWAEVAREGLDRCPSWP